MNPPKSALGRILTAVAGLGGAAWLGAAVNSRKVAATNPSAATAGAALGAVTGAAVATFGSVLLASSRNTWNDVGATGALLGTGGFAALAIIGLGSSDRMLRSTSSQPQALTAGEADSGRSIAMKVGDTLTVELPASQAGYAWVWSQATSGLVSGPTKTTATVDGGAMEHDAFTATSPGSTTLTAALTPAAGGPSIATWQASLTVS